MAEDASTKLLHDFWERALGQGDRDIVEQIVDPNFNINAPGLREGEITGRGPIKEFVEQVRIEFPNLHVSIEPPETTENGDMVTSWRAESTNRRRVEDESSSGSFETAGASRKWWGKCAARISDGQIEKMWVITLGHVAGGTKGGTWTTMAMDHVVESVPGDGVFFARQGRPWWCCIFHC